MRRKIVLLTTCMLLLLGWQSIAQTVDPATYFKEAYAAYPNLPKGLLEAAAYSASRMDNLHVTETEATNCMGMPLQYGLFGLIEDGKGYFTNTMAEVCALSNITTDQFKKDIRLQILSVAKYLSKRSAAARVAVEDFSAALEDLSGIPADGSSVNTFARKSHSYDIYRHLQTGFNTPFIKVKPGNIQLKKIYSESTLRVLQSPGIKLSVKQDQVVTPDGTTVTPTAHGSVSANSEMGVLSADYGPAIWNPAASCNFNTGRGATITHVAIHTTEGSYASTISWFKNCNASVSAHYVVRSSDGQITQMVLESNTAWHIANNNSYTVGIEHEAFAGQTGWLTEALYQASAGLTRDICASHGIDVNTCYRGPSSSVTNPISQAFRIKGHQHFPITNSKWDPGPHWNWPKYADLLRPGITIPYGVYRIVHAATGRVIDAQGCLGDNGVIPNLWDWWGGDCQRWLFEPTGDGYYKISSRMSGRVLDNDRCLATDGNKIQLWDWLNNDCQRWRIEDWGNGTIKLVNKASGKLLDVQGDGTANGTPIFQWSQTGANAQRWVLQPVSANYIANGTYRIRMGKNDKVLEPAGGNDNRGAAMNQWDWVDSSYQKWTIENTPDGWYKLATPKGFALDVENCNTAEGGKVMLWDWLNNDCQRWSLGKVESGKWTIQSKISGKVLDAPDNINGGVVYQWTWLNNDNQKWFIEAPPAPAVRKGVPITRLFVTPNPVTTGAHLQVGYVSDVAQPGTILVTDLYGRVIQQRKVSIQPGNNRFTVFTSLLKPGVYNTTIQANNSQRSESRKVIVVK